jgi:hypothetical protein
MAPCSLVAIGASAGTVALRYASALGPRPTVAATTPLVLHVPAHSPTRVLRIPVRRVPLAPEAAFDGDATLAGRPEREVTTPARALRTA